jgi:hypothetical protein
MLVIRAAQMRAFEEVAWVYFESRMAAHLREYFPVDVALLGEHGVRSVVSHRIAAARAHGLSTEGGICSWIDLTLTFGAGFGHDPLFPWAAEIVAESAGDPEAGVLPLKDAAIRYLRRVGGARGTSIVRAFRRAHGTSFDELTSPSRDAVSWLRDLWPERFHDPGATDMEAFLALARDRAEEARFPEEGHVVYTTLAFLLGSDFAKDPLYAWAADALSDPGLAGRGRVHTMTPGRGRPTP